MKRRRSPPRRAIIVQGLHPHPGPTCRDCGFDDSEGPEWDESDEVAAELSSDGEAGDGWRVGMELQGEGGDDGAGAVVRNATEHSEPDGGSAEDEPVEVWEEMRL